MNKQQYAKLAIMAARLADDKKASDIVIYDVSKISSLFYYVALVTAESMPQIKAVEEELTILLKKEGLYSLHKDGTTSAKWRVLDYGGFIFHILDSQTRQLYALDKLYVSCQQLKWRKSKKKMAVKKNATSKVYRKRIRSSLKNKSTKKITKKNAHKKS